MTIFKKLSLVAIIATSGLTQATSMIGFDNSLLKPWVTKAEQAVAKVAKKGYASAKALYLEQKRALKNIKAELKNAYKSAKASADATWFTKKQTYKAFKKAVYKNWKKTRLFPSL